eukprot:356739-Chlamydomonas_euryale.AAC.1
MPVALPFYLLSLVHMAYDGVCPLKPHSPILKFEVQTAPPHVNVRQHLQPQQPSCYTMSHNVRQHGRLSTGPGPTAWHALTALVSLQGPQQSRHTLRSAAPSPHFEVLSSPFTPRSQTAAVPLRPEGVVRCGRIHVYYATRSSSFATLGSQMAWYTSTAFACVRRVACNHDSSLRPHAQLTAIACAAPRLRGPGPTAPDAAAPAPAAAACAWRRRPL